MTRAERENVLHCLKVMIDEEVFEECNLYGTTGTDHCEADCVRMAIKLLEQEPTTKNDLGVDLISRADVLKLMKDNWHTHDGDWAMQESMDDIRALPSAIPQERKGHWIPTYGNVECSVCGSVKDSREVGKATHYCDFCGAKMESEE